MPAPNSPRSPRPPDRVRIHHPPQPANEDGAPVPHPPSFPEAFETRASRAPARWRCRTQDRRRPTGSRTRGRTGRPRCRSSAGWDPRTSSRSHRHGRPTCRWPCRRSRSRGRPTFPRTRRPRPNEWLASSPMPARPSPCPPAIARSPGRPACRSSSRTARTRSPPHPDGTGGRTSPGSRTCANASQEAVDRTRYGAPASPTPASPEPVLRPCGTRANSGTAPWRSGAPRAAPRRTAQDWSRCVSATVHVHPVDAGHDAMAKLGPAAGDRRSTGHGTAPGVNMRAPDADGRWRLPGG
ncbi:hypothetical protein ABIA38_005541 [Embleya sp. AB8]